MSPTMIVVLHAVKEMHGVSGYNPTIGEVAKVAGVSYGVADRCIIKLCELKYCECHESIGARVRYRFSSTQFGNSILLSKGRS